MNTRRLTRTAMFAAMCAVLGYLAVDLGNLKITFESLPVLVAAIAFGPVEGLLVGTIGTLIYQLLRYGVTVTTALWILPYTLCGLVVGFCSGKNPGKKRIAFSVSLGELIVFILNTVALYVDSKIFGYYSKVYIFGTVWVRLLLCATKAAAFSLLVPGILKAIRNIQGKREGK